MRWIEVIITFQAKAHLPTLSGGIFKVSTYNLPLKLARSAVIKREMDPWLAV
jgi:hypothetical protein